jgi:hypothetical protein
MVRGFSNLPLSELEIVTLAYTITNAGIYVAWWDKPRNVDRPIRVYTSKSVDETREEMLRNRSPIDDQRNFMCSVLQFLSPGANGYSHFCCSANVPTFYSGRPKQGQDFWLSAFIASAIGTVFGAILCIPWSYSFTSHAEQLLWRVSSVIMVAIPLVTFTLSKAVFSGEVGESLLHKIVLRIFVIAVPIGLIFCVLIYVVARVTMFVLAFKTLASLPAQALHTIPWTKWIPHI